MEFRVYHERDSPVTITTANKDTSPSWVVLDEWYHVGTIEACLVGILRDIEATARDDAEMFQNREGFEARYDFASALKEAARAARLKLESANDL